MSYDTFTYFQNMCYGQAVGIIGPKEGAMSRDLNPLDIFVLMNCVDKPDMRCDIWIDNGSGASAPWLLNSSGFIFESTVVPEFRDRNCPRQRFLSGPVGWDELATEPPELWIDNAWHHSLGFSPLAGVVALWKVSCTGARKIYMLGQDLYGGDQAKANAHDLKKNAAYIARLADLDRRIVLCSELREIVNELTL